MYMSRNKALLHVYILEKSFGKVKKNGDFAGKKKKKFTKNSKDYGSIRVLCRRGMSQIWKIS
jgi:hypothetical protein